MNRVEKRVRNMINPYSTAFARWWCHSGRYMRLPRMITGNKTAVRPGLPRPAAHRPSDEVSIFIPAPSSPQAPNPWRADAESGFGEADRRPMPRS
jgi:hypothetical protein